MDKIFSLATLWGLIMLWFFYQGNAYEFFKFSSLAILGALLSTGLIFFWRSALPSRWVD